MTHGYALLLPTDVKCLVSSQSCFLNIFLDSELISATVF